MTCWWPLALVLLGIAVASADSPPAFTAAGLARGDRPAKSVVPGTYLTIYGTNLGLPPGQSCGTGFPKSTYPKEYCGTQVLLGDMPAELLYVSDKQINFKVPQDAPNSGTVDIRVVFTGKSSRPITMRSSAEWATVSLDAPAYTDMPVWLKIDLPFEGAVGYPSDLGPAGFGCNMVEVRRNGQRLPPACATELGVVPIRVGGYIADPMQLGRKCKPIVCHCICCTGWTCREYTKSVTPSGRCLSEWCRSRRNSRPAPSGLQSRFCPPRPISAPTG